MNKIISYNFYEKCIKQNKNQRIKTTNYWQYHSNLSNIYNFNPSSFLLIKNYELIENNKLEDYNIKNGDKIYIILIENRIIENINNQNLYNKVIFNNQLTSLYQIPKLIKKGYKINQPYYLFYRMTFYELRNDENFSIENEKGKI